MMETDTKQRIRHAFAGAAAHYDEAALVQRRVADTLLRLLPDTMAPPPKTFLDAGCGTAYVARCLQQQFPDTSFIGLDFALPMLKHLPPNSVLPVAGDQEELPLADASVDGYISSLSLQWCAFAKAMAEAQRVLRPGGLLAISTLVSGTFAELGTAFAGLDKHPHTLDFLAPEDVLSATHKAGFVEIRHLVQQEVSHYPDLRHLLEAIRKVGAHQIGSERRKGLISPRAWKKVADSYESHRTAKGLPLSYQCLFLLAHKA